KEKWGELGVPSRLAREVREYGEAIISATQQADVADSLIANRGTKIILRTDYPKDVEFASRLLQIDSKWATKTPMGSAVVRLPARYYQAFLLTFPEHPLKNTVVTDAQITRRYTQYPQPITAHLDAETIQEVLRLNEFAHHTGTELAWG